MLETSEIKKIPAFKGLTTPGQAAFLRHSLVILLYLLVALAFTWPLALNMGDHTPGSLTYDRDQNLWTLWWSRQALTNLHVNPYFTNFLYYPGGVNLFLFPTNLTTGVISLPLQALFGLVPSFNLLYFLGVVGGAWGIYCLAYYLTGDNTGAFLAGLVFAFAPWQNPASEFNQLNIIQFQWLAFFTLWVVKFLDWLFPGRAAGRLTLPLAQVLQNRAKYQLRYGTLAALFLVLIAFTDQYHLLFAAFLLVWLSLAPLLRLLARQNWREAGISLVKLALLVVPAGVAFSPVMLGIIRDARSGAFLDTENNLIKGLDLWSLFNPWGIGSDGKSLQLERFRFPDPVYYYSIGWWVILGLALVAAWKLRAARSWAFLALATAVLALGGSLIISDLETGLPLPGRLVSEIPVLKVMHYAWRWLLVASLGLAVASAYGVSWLRQKFLDRPTPVETAPRRKQIIARTKYAALPVLVLICLTALQPFPVAWEKWVVPPAPAVFGGNVLTQPGALLELPFSEHNRDKADNMRYQTSHNRPIVGGYMARQVLIDYAASPFAFFYEEYPVASRDVIPVSPEGARSMLAYYNFGYMLLYKDNLDNKRQERFRQIIEQTLGPVKTACTYEDAQVLACPVVPPQTAVPFLALTKGWYNAEAENGGQRWLRGQEGYLGMFVPATGTYKLNFEGAAYRNGRQLVVEVDGQPQAQVTIQPDRQDYSIELKITGGSHIIRLYSPEPPDRPSNHGTPSDTRTLTLLFSKLNLVKS
jgi:hypothetical protein